MKDSWTSSKQIRCLGIAGVCLLLFSWEAPGQVVTSPHDADRDRLAEIDGDDSVRLDLGSTTDRQVLFTPYIWAISLHGDTTVGRVSADVDVEFLDFLRGVDTVIGFQGALEIPLGEFSLMIGASYVHAEKDDVTGTAGPLEFKLDGTTNLGWFELGAAIPLIESPRSHSRPTCSIQSLDLIAGGRLTLLSLESDAQLDGSASLPTLGIFDFDREGSFDKNRIWGEPFVGFRSVIGLNDSTVLSMRADVGGFGAGSDFAWQASAMIGWDIRLFDHDATLFAGYRALSQDYESGSFEWDVIAHGPGLALQIRF